MRVREIKGWSEITICRSSGIRARACQPARRHRAHLDLRCRFGQGLTEATALHIVIIVQIASRQVGLLADRVLTSFVRTARVQPVPRVANGSRVGFLSGLVDDDSGMSP